MKLIETHNGYRALLGPKVPEPSKSWQRLQRRPPTPDVQWYSAYPLNGGAMFVQEDAFTVLGDATKSDVECAIDRGFNPAAKTILELWDAVNHR